MSRTLRSLALLPVLALLACGDDDGAGNNNHVFYFCGNSVAEGAEACDGVDLKGQTCLTVPGGFLGGTLTCNAACTGFETRLCEGGGVCANGTAESGEACDGLDLKGQTCATIGQGYTGGTLGCSTDCRSFVTTGCTGGVHCGNNVREGTEACDGADLGGLDCTTVAGDFVGGTLACNGNCTAFITSGCESAFCGDNVAEGAEPCDGNDLNGATCASIGQGFVDGDLACNGTCSGWVTTGCRAPVCGDGLAEGAEPCDGDDLGTATCTTVPGGFDAGTLACNATCDGWNTSACVEWCGNGVLNPGEVCDGTDLDGNDCTTVPGGFAEGTLACNATCGGFVTTGCVRACGNGVLNGTEACDGDDFGGVTCASLGFHGGPLVCSATCDEILVSACNPTPAVCGDGVAELVEYCDGADLGGYTSCAQIGFSGGTLACGPDCRFDVTGCTGDMCALQDWYNDGYCDLCEYWGGTVDPDCATVCHAADLTCGSYVDALLGASTCLVSQGTEDPDCGTCGDGTLDPSLEYCDGSDLGDLTGDCGELGFASGTFTCASGCNFDTTACVPAVCGNGVLEGLEQCDDASTLAGDGCDATCHLETLAESEANGTWQTADGPVTGYILFTGSISPAYDLDYLRIDLPVAATLTAMQLDNAAGDCANSVIDSELRLYASNGTTQLMLGEDIDADNWCGGLQATNLAAGTYYLRVAASQAYAASSTFAYTVAVIRE
jgi:cysteine-rich repeat protein